MGKKKRNKNKKEKKSDGSTGNVNGGSHNNNNNNNNDITIPTVATTTTTIVLTTEELEFIDIEQRLKGYPKSNDFLIGFKLTVSDQEDPAIASFKRGAENDGCVPCMYYYAIYIIRQHDWNNLHLTIPYALEGAIRGHVLCMNLLVHFYQKTKPFNSLALQSFWFKTKVESGGTEHTEKRRKEVNKRNANSCTVCLKKESEDNDVTLVKCGICKFYTYCGKNCQTYHWKDGKHMNECRQVILLRKYCKPSYVKEIRDAIIGGQDPKEIHTLQRLRMKLGLNRPKEEYEELLRSLANDDDNNNNNNSMKRGTKVKIKGLVSASKHNGKFGIVTKASIPGASIPGEAGGSTRVGVKLSDESGTVLSIKIENLEPTPTTTTNRLNPLDYLTARKDGTVHIGSTANTI